MISISTSQTFRSWLVIFHLRQPMAFLSLNLCDTPGLAPRMNVWFWRPGDFQESYSNRDTSWSAWNRHSESFMVDKEILFSDMKSPSHECYMTFWPLPNSDFSTDQTFQQFRDLDTKLDLHRIMSGFHGAFATGVACQPRTLLTLPNTWFSPLFWTCLCSNCWDQIPWTCHVFTRLLTLNTPWYVLSRFCFSERIRSLECVLGQYWPPTNMRNVLKQLIVILN